MIRKIHVLQMVIMSLLLGIIFSSCNNCENIDCVSSDFMGYFQIISKSNGGDLLVGPGKLYDKDKIKVFTFRKTDTIKSYLTIRINEELKKSLITCEFKSFDHGNNIEEWFIQYGNGDTDTLNLTFESKKTECCGVITKIQNFRFNHSVDLKAEEGKYLIEK